MSAAKRSREPRPEAQAASPPPASKRVKASHLPSKPGLDFLVDEDARARTRLSAKLTNGVARPRSNRVDESHAVRARHSADADDEDGGAAVQPAGQPRPDIIEISSRDESSSDHDDDHRHAEATAPKDRGLPVTNGHAADAEGAQAGPGAAVADDLDMDGAEAAAEQEPSFGEQLQARHPDTIDVHKTLHGHGEGDGALISARDGQVAPAPTAGSMATVLAQALKTNDQDLLESCFAMTDVNAIRATIQRQQSQQVAILLQRLAERVHKRPGRAGKLMIWIQWSLVTHGAYLAHQPALMKDLKSLAQVTRDRASGLQPLLHLKGKLDLLSAQLEARRNLQAASRAANDEDDADDVLYIEGQDRGWSSDEDDNVAPSGRPGKRPAAALERATEAASDNASADDERVPTGFINGIEDDSSAGGDEDDERDGLLDDEAEEVSEDESSDEDAESNASSLDKDESSEGEESEVEAAVKPPKPHTLDRKR